jgi:hypothetical protein
MENNPLIDKVFDQFNYCQEEPNIFNNIFEPNKINDIFYSDDEKINDRSTTNNSGSGINGNVNNTKKSLNNVFNCKNEQIIIDGHNQEDIDKEDMIYQESQNFNKSKSKKK